METTENLSKPIENLSKKPAKGILKTTSSSEHQQPPLNRQKYVYFFWQPHNIECYG